MNSKTNQDSEEELHSRHLEPKMRLQLSHNICKTMLSSPSPASYVFAWASVLMMSKGPREYIPTFSFPILPPRVLSRQILYPELGPESPLASRETPCLMGREIFACS